MAEKRNEIVFLTELRAFACIAIVFLHTFYAAMEFSPSSSEQMIALTVRNLMMWAVPCFVMVTGTLLLDKTKNVTYAKLFQKYLPRVILSLFLFSALFALLDAIGAGEPIGIGIILTGWKQAVLGKSWSHLWYLYLIIGLYLLIPFYRKIAVSLEKKDACYLLGVYLLFLSILPMLETLTAFKSAFYICVYSVYPVYLFLGYAIHQNLLPVPRFVWAFLAILGTISIGLLTIVSKQYELAALSKLLTSYAFPVTVLQAAGIYGVLCKKTVVFPNWLKYILQKIDACSFGIYLIHMIFLKVIMVYCNWNPYAHGGTWMVLLIAIGVMIGSFICVWLLKRVPGLRKIL